MKSEQSVLSDDLIINFDEKTNSETIELCHYHNTYEIYILQTGNRQIFIDDTLFYTKAGDVVLMKPDTFHYNCGETPYSGYCIRFSENFIRALFPNASPEELLSDCRAISLNEDTLGKVLQLIEKLTKPSEQSGAYFIELFKILCDTAEDKNCVLHPTESPYCTYMKNHFTEDISLEQIAFAYGISRNYLCIAFKQEMGLTVLKYLNILRIRQGCILLATETDAAIHLSEKCGFASPSYFTRCFRESFGCTPKEFRKQRSAK